MIDQRPIPSIAPLLSVRGLSIGVTDDVGTRVAVDDVSFDIGRAESMALVGESGSGKSLTAQAILGLLPRGTELRGGSVTLDGTETVSLRTGMPAGVRGRKIGAVFQDPLASLNPTMRVGEQVAEVFRAHDRLGRKAARDAAIESLAEAGIPEPMATADRFPHELSGGQRQRVMIATALALRPPLLIADEPTTALDLTIQAQIIELIQRLQEEHELAVLLITHDLALVAEVARTVVVLYAGRIMEKGPLREVFENSRNPYTRALLNSSATGDRSQPLAPIPGTPPRAGEAAVGCPFASRCYMATELCRQSRPTLEPVVGYSSERPSMGWRSACHYRDAVEDPVA